MVLGKIGDVLDSISSMRNADAHENAHHLKLAADWLLEAQGASGGTGYAHSYHLLRGWERPYPETTGYIIPTMLEAGKRLKNEEYVKSAVSAGEWLLGIQGKEGYFADLSGNAQVFDTGQIIYGLLALHGWKRDEKYLDAAERAGKWLVERQEEDGSWVRNAYNSVPHSYYSRVGAILVRLGEECGKREFLEGGVKNLEWVMKQREGDGYFENMGFAPGKAPYLHTIIYVLEGLLLGWERTGDKRMLSSVMKAAEKLREINEERDFILLSQYGKGWEPVNNQKCLTGLAQWAGLALKLYGINKDEKYLNQAVKTLHYLKTRQMVKGSRNIMGAIPGSVPIWGNYGRFAFLNWNAKFFMDALLESEGVGITAKQERETFRSQKLEFNKRNAK